MRELQSLPLALIYTTIASLRHCLGRTDVCVLESQRLCCSGDVATPRIGTYLHSICCVNNSAALHYWEAVKVRYIPLQLSLWPPAIELHYHVLS